MNKYLKQFLEKLNISSNEEVIPVAEQAVIIYFDYNLESSDPFYEVVDKLRNCVEQNHLGEYDGHEMAMDHSDGSFYMYSTNAQKLFNGIESILRNTEFLEGARVIVRGEHGHEEIIIL